MRKEKTHYAFDMRAVERLIPTSCTYLDRFSPSLLCESSPRLRSDDGATGPPRLKQLVIDCCKSNPNDRPDFKETLNILKDIQKEVELDELRSDRARSTPPSFLSLSGLPRCCSAAAVVKKERS